MCEVQMMNVYWVFYTM